MISKGREILNSELPGVNVSGWITLQNGHGEVARGMIAALQLLKIPVALNDFSFQHDKIAEKDNRFTDSSSTNPHPVNLLCTNVNFAHEFYYDAGSGYFQNKYNIGVWAWETPEFPPQWQSRFNLLNELWVGSSFVKDSIAPISPVPVFVMKPVIEFDTSKAYSKQSFGLPSDEFTFLFVFDCISGFLRKNPLALVKAFRLAFSADQKVRLLLKCTNAHLNSDEFEQLSEEVSGDPRITIMNGFLSREKLLGLMSACDCYLSLHRAEGFGLTMAESMRLGKPVIATGWSGNMGFHDT